MVILFLLFLHICEICAICGQIYIFFLLSGLLNSFGSFDGYGLLLILASCFKISFSQVISFINHLSCDIIIV